MIFQTGIQHDLDSSADYNDDLLEVKREELGMEPEDDSLRYNAHPLALSVLLVGIVHRDPSEQIGVLHP